MIKLLQKASLTFILTVMSFWAIAQNGTIKGKVVTKDGQPVEYATIALKGFSKGATTNAQGFYKIANVKPGNYSLIVSFIDFSPSSVDIQVKTGEVLTVQDVILEANAAQLNEVVVATNAVRKQSNYVSKMPLKNLENPQVYNTIDSKTLKEQVVVSFDDALKNAPGLEKLWESTGRGVDGAGYYSLRGFSVQPTLVNGLPGLTNGSLDMVNVERIEVLKGPSGTLFGSSLVSYGGLINTVTKKPYEGFGGEINYITGSYGLNRVTADINTPIDKQKAFILRVNAAYHTEDSYQDAGYRKAFAIAPTLSFKASDKLSFLVSTEFLSSETTNQTMLFLDRGAPLTVPTIDQLHYDYKRSYTSNDLGIKNPTSNFQAQMIYKLADKWTSQSIVSTGKAKSNGYYTYLYETSQSYQINGSVFGRYGNKQNNWTNTTDIQQNFIGNFTFASKINNKVVAGLDYYQNNAQDNNTGYVSNGSIYMGTANPQEVYNVVFNGTETPGFDSGILSQPAMDKLLADVSVNNTKTKQETYSAYVSDVINFEEIGLAAMASLRVDHFNTKGDLSTPDDDYEQTAFSPKFGLVYQPIKDRISIFGNYMNGFANVNPQIGESGSIESFKPEEANQLEFGVKTNLIKNRLTSTFSYYDIKVKNKVMTDFGTDENGDPFTYSVQGGEVESKGFEIDLNSNPVNGLDIMLGYSYNDSKILKASMGNFFAVPGRRPSEAGPKNMFNGWATYRITNGTLNGLGFGFGANIASERLIMDSPDIGVFALPAYTIFNASVSYYAKNYKLILKGDNITNEIYYKGWSTINPQRPRSVSLSLAYSF